MSDQVRDFSNDLDRLFQPADDAALGGLLGDQGAPAPAPTETPPPPPPPKAPQGGLTPLISKTVKDIEELEDKILNHRTTGAYRKDDGNGNAYYDVTEQMDDQAKLQMLNRKLSDLRDRQRDGQREESERSTSVQAFARSFIQREAPKIAEKHRNEVLKHFGQLYQHFAASNEWSKPKYADRRVLGGAMTNLLETAIGMVAKQFVYKADGAPPGLTGLDEDDEAKRKENPEGEDDEFTANLMQAFERRKGASLSVADLKRQRAAEAKGGAQ